MQEIVIRLIPYVAALLALLILCAFFGRPLRRTLAARVRAQELRNTEREVVISERRFAAEIASRTATDTAELKNAELRLKRAQLDADAAVAAEVVPAKVEAEQQVIAARGRARARRAAHDALTGIDPGYVEALSRAYVAYVNNNNAASWGTWIGNTIAQLHHRGNCHAASENVAVESGRVSDRAHSPRHIIAFSGGFFSPKMIR